MIAIKHSLASSKDKKPTINSSEFEQHNITLAPIITCYYQLQNNMIAVIEYKQSRNGKTYYGNKQLPIGFNTPKIGQPVTINITKIETKDELRNRI
jgi:hypothetical protein